MFGVHGTGDTSGYGGLTRATPPGEAQRPYGGWYDEVADALEAAGSATVASRSPRPGSSSTAARSPSTCGARDLLVVAKLLRDDERLRFEFCSGVSGVHYPRTPGASCMRSTTCSR